MEIAAVHAIAELTQAEQNEVVARAYAGFSLKFGPEYLIPKPFDPRLMMMIAPAVAKAAAESGVAQRPIADFDAYREKLQAFVYASGTTMKPIFNLAKRAPNRRIAYAEGEEERVLRAVQVVVDEGLARPTLIGRPGDHRPARRALRAAAAGRARLRPRQHRARRALPRLLADLPPADRAQGRHRAARQDRDAAPPDADRRDAAAPRRGRRHAVRHLGHHPDAPALHRPGDRPARRRPDLCLHERADPAEPAGDAGRHPRQLRPDRRAAGRDHRDGGRGNAAPRAAAEGGAAVAQQLRIQQPPVGAEDARRARPAARARALARGRRRDAWRHRTRRRRCASS